MKLNKWSVMALGLSILAPLTSSFAGGSIESIQVANSVTSDQSALLQKDLDFLKAHPLTAANPELQSIMGVSDLTTDTMVGWLEDRVHYVVDENYDLEKNLFVAKKTWTYENPGIYPVMEKPTKDTGAADPATTPTPAASAPVVKTVMSNIGGAIYLMGKQNGFLIGMNIDGVGKVNVTSPRTGILQVGSGLFAKMLGETTPMDSIAYTAFRLTTLFHEARHSDGNGKSTGFLHAICQGGDYDGYAACDRNLNGPYQLGGDLDKALGDSCTDCTAGDKRIIDILAADNYSRQIKFTPDSSNDMNAIMISAYQNQIEVCKLFTQLHMPAPTTLDCNIDNLNKKIADLRAAASTTTGVASTVWDPTPEGQF